MRSASNADWLPDRYSVVPVNSFHWRVKVFLAKCLQRDAICRGEEGAALSILAEQRDVSLSRITR